MLTPNEIVQHQSEIRNSFAQLMILIRERNDMSMSAMGKRIGVARTTIHNYENANSPIPLEVMFFMIQQGLCSSEELGRGLADG